MIFINFTVFFYYKTFGKYLKIFAKTVIKHLKMTNL